jgi:AraC-like DNA-binding protein
MLGCTNNGSFSNDNRGKGHVPQPSDTLYTEQAAMDVYATQPERALQIIDSAEMVGNLAKVRADMLRAKVYSRTTEFLQFDSAILIAERLMQDDEVLADPDMQEETLEILLNACRLRKDNEEALHWATQLGQLYREGGEETEALRIDAEIGTFLMRIGQQPEGLAKMDSVIHQLGGKRKFNELDALIIALKRKAEVCYEFGLYDEMIPAAQQMLELLDNYEQHPADYHDGNIREPSDDDRPFYIDFYRGKAYCYLAIAFSSIGVEGLEKSEAQVKAREYISLYEQTYAGQNIQGRFMIAPLLRKMGEYDRMLAIYDEVEQQLDNDTLNANYAEILRGRAEAAEAQGCHAEASDYWKRYAELNETLSERLLQGKAHLYAARFQAQKQQMEIERHAIRERMQMRVIVILFITLTIVILIAVFTVYQKRKLAEKNATMVKLIDEKEEQSQLLSNPVEDTGEDFALFRQMDHRIRTERLYADQGIQRDEIAEVLGMKRETINQLLNKYAGGKSIPAYLNDIRLSEACKMLREQSDATISEVADQVGLTLRNLQRLFREQYGMSPSEYRYSHN